MTVTPPPYGEPTRSSPDAATWRAEDVCHCGQPVHTEDGFTRGLCEHCSLVRCDAFPGACKDALRDKIVSLLQQRFSDLNLSWAPERTLPPDAAHYLADAVLPIVAAEVTAAREQGQVEAATLRADLAAAQAKVERVEALRDRLRVADHHSGLNYHHGTRYADWLTSALDGTSGQERGDDHG